MSMLSAVLSETQMQLKTRINPRFLARIAFFHGPYQNTILTDYSINISTGGVFLETVRTLPKETLLTVKFVLPNSFEIITAKARVAWLNDSISPKKPSLPAGMGLQFLELSDKNKDIIQDFLINGKFNPTW